MRYQLRNRQRSQYVIIFTSFLSSLQSILDSAFYFIRKHAEKDLQALLRHFASLTVQHAFMHKLIRFIYIPARSLHWGGVYEHLISLNRSTLKNVIDNSLFTFEELCTLVKEIQAVFNNRPLTAINSDIHDLQQYTLNHLLFGFNVTSLPHPPLDLLAYDPSFGDELDISRV